MKRDMAVPSLVVVENKLVLGGLEALLDGSAMTFHQPGCEHWRNTRTRLSLDKDTPIPRAIDFVGHILARPILGNL